MHAALVMLSALVVIHLWGWLACQYNAIGLALEGAGDHT